MFYSDELVEEVRSRNDIVDVIGGYVSLQKKGSAYFGLCPFHNEKTPSFSVSRDKQMFYCFGCGAGGNVFSFLMKYDSCTFPEAMQVLAERAGMSLPDNAPTEAQKRESDFRAQLLSANKEAATYYYKLLRSKRGERARNYFAGRGLSPETMQRFGLGYSDQYGDDLYRYLRKKGYSDEVLKDSGLCVIDEKRGGYDRFWNRAMFPIMDVRSRVIGFGGRVMGEGEPKYLNSPETRIFDKSHNLFGLHIAHRSRKNFMLLCEGYMDVISMHQAGFDNAVASLGTALTSGHASLLKRYTKEVYLTYDSDGAGIKAALRAIPILKEVGIPTKVVNLLPYKDPDELIKACGAQEYEKRIAEAENNFMFEIRMLEREYDMGDPQGKTDFFNATAKKLLAFPEEIERDNYIDAIAKKYQVEPENLKKLTARMALAGENIKMPTQPRSLTHEKKKKEDGMEQSQKLLLTWLIEDGSLYEKIEGLITADDFFDEPYHRVAQEIFGQYEREGEANPAKIISMFEDEEEQGRVAGIFNARIENVESREERQKALSETIIRIKKNSIDRHVASVPNVAAMQRIIDERKELDELERMRFF
ncbi:MAG: DNA primase [Clostridiales bacterium]|nr:DNA primase [Clostridiales bacterium]